MSAHTHRARVFHVLLIAAFVALAVACISLGSDTRAAMDERIADRFDRCVQSNGWGTDALAACLRGEDQR